MHWVPKFGRFQIAHKISGRLNAWSGRYVDLGPKTGLFALLDRSRYELRASVKGFLRYWQLRVTDSERKHNAKQLTGGEKS